MYNHDHYRGPRQQHDAIGFPSSSISLERFVFLGSLLGLAIMIPIQAVFFPEMFTVPWEGCIEKIHTGAVVPIYDKAHAMFVTLGTAFVNMSIFFASWWPAFLKCLDAFLIAEYPVCSYLGKGTPTDILCKWFPYMLCFVYLVKGALYPCGIRISADDWAFCKHAAFVLWFPSWILFAALVVFIFVFLIPFFCIVVLGVIFFLISCLIFALCFIFGPILLLVICFICYLVMLFMMAVVLVAPSCLLGLIFMLHCLLLIDYCSPQDIDER